MTKKCISAFAALALLGGLSFAGEIVLQNGMNGYNGCTDTYFYSIGNGTQFAFKYQNDNYHAEVTTMTANCAT